MRTHGLDALICRLPENVLLLTGFWPLSCFAFAFLPLQRPASLIAVETEVPEVPEGAAADVRSFRWGVLDATDPYREIEAHLREVARAAGVERGRIGYETGFEAVAVGHMAAEMMVPAGVTHATIASALPEATLVDAGPALNASRAIKTLAEVEKLRRANTVAIFGLEAFSRLFEPGKTEAEIAAGVEAAIMSRGIGHEGARHVRSWAQLMTGPESARAYTPHPATSARVVEPGDLGVLELATVVDGYWSDLTRTLVAGGSPTSRQQELYDAVMTAYRAVVRDARPGMTGREVDALAREEIERRGLGRYFVHHTGHGLGFRYHEPIPFLHPVSEVPVRAGMVTSVEPGLYVEGFGGIRVEDNAVLRDQGLEILSSFGTAIDARR
jgi:Xaa-Pro aminopeptidase